MCHLSEIPKQIDGLNESRWSTPPMFPVHRTQYIYLDSKLLVPKGQITTKEDCRTIDSPKK